MIEYVHPDLAYQLTRLGPLGIVVWNGEPPGDAAFESHCVVASEWVRDGGPFSVFLNVAGSFTPSASQRQIVAARREEMGLSSIHRIAILTDSVLARGALMVLTWLARSKSIETRGFRPHEIALALEWLEQSVPGIDVAGAVAACERAESRFRDARTATG